MSARAAYEVRAPVYDSSEIGLLANQVSTIWWPAWSNGSSCETFSVAMLAATWRSMRYSKASDFTGRLCEAGVVFIDLAGSTALATTSSPDHVAAVLNAFFRIVVGIIDDIWRLHQQVRR